MKRLIYILLFLQVLISGCSKDKLDTANTIKIESGTTSRLNRIVRLGKDKLIAVGGQIFNSAEVLTSTDGGKSFSASTYPEAGKALYGITTDDNNNTYICGYDGKLLTSNDTGRSWSFHQVFHWFFYNGIAVTSNNNLILTSTNAQNYGTIIRLNSNKEIIDTTYFKFGMNDIAMPTPTTGYITGYGVILKTTDGGDTWQYLDIKNDNFMSIHCLNENEAWVVGYGGSIWRTKDGGTNWERLRNGNNLFIKGHSFLNVLFKDSNTGWACGEKGLLVKTEDGGKSWTEYSGFTDVAIRDMVLTDTHLITVGDNGSIYRIPL